MASNAQNGTADLSHQDMAYSYVTDYGRYGPLAQVNTAETRLPAFGDELQPGLYKPPKDHKVANPTPLGLFAFAYSVFLPGLIQMQVKNIMVPNILVGPALAYGGLVQLLAGMWEMAIGNTFGATVLSSYGDFWISVGIVFTPGGFEIMTFSIYPWGWFIFTTMIIYVTLRSTVALCALFVVVDTSVLLLALAYMIRDEQETPHANLQKAGGIFAILTTSLAWYNDFAGLAENSNSFFVVPVVHFLWSERGRKSRKPE